MNKTWIRQAIQYHRKKNCQEGPLWNYIHDLGILHELEFILPQIMIDWKYGVFLY